MKHKDKDPIDEALSERDKVAAVRAAQDHQLWQQWKQEPTHDNMDHLMTRFDPLIKGKGRMWKAPQVNQAAMLTNLRIHAVDAFQTYDPNKGAALRTHLESRLRPAMRFNQQHQNYAYMPEEQVGQIGNIQKAQDTLSEDLGRPPTSAEIVGFVNPQLQGRRKLTEKKVNRIIEGQRKDIVGSAFESDPTPHAINREREVAGLLRPNLNAQQQEVFDHLYGKNGKAKTDSTTRIAKSLGKSPSQVSRMRTDILKKFNEYM